MNKEATKKQKGKHGLKSKILSQMPFIVGMFFGLFLVFPFVTNTTYSGWNHYYQTHGYIPFKPSDLCYSNISGESMQPTLYGDEKVVLDCSERIKETLSYGDIISIQTEYENEETGGPLYIMKRVIGMGGDRIEFDEQGVWRNGELLEEPYVKDPDWAKETYRKLKIKRYSGRLMNEDGRIQFDVPEDHLFVLGDNRLNSGDSRNERYGYIHIETQVVRRLIR